MSKHKSVGEEMPELIQYFVNKEDAFKYSLRSNKFVILSCPDCHKERTMKVCKLTTNGFNCHYCSKGISYPNRYLRALLKQLDLDHVEYEYNAAWTLGKRYDAYIKHHKKEYLIEMDGRQHYEKAIFDTTVEEQQRNDAFKDFIALGHGIAVIHIDCCISDATYIKNQIQQSQIVKEFDLSNVDWNLCERDATSNTTKRVVDFYNGHKDLSSKEIAQHLKIHMTTVIRQLKQASELGLCDYNLEQVKQKGKLKGCVTRNSRREPFEVIDGTGKKIGEYKTVRSCLNDLNKLYPDIKFYPSDISNSGLATETSINGFVFRYLCGLEEYYKDNQLMHDVVAYYNEHSYMFNEEIGKHFNIHKDTVRKFLIAGNKIGLCDYDTSKRYALAQSKGNKNRHKKVS